MPKWLIFLFFSASLQAEELPTYELVDLVYYSAVIFTAKPLAEAKYVINTREGGDDLRRFVIQQVIKQDSAALPDTITINFNDYEFGGAEFSEYIFYGRYDPPTYPYHPWVFYPVLSGIRPFRGSTAFEPHQHDNPGGYYLHAAPDQTLSDWVFQTRKTMNRFDSLLVLRRIEPLEAQNKALFEWIDQHHSCWKRDTVIDYHPFNACDWGPFEFEVFEWINGNGIWQDAWKGIQLSGLIRGEYGTVLTRPENTPIAFSSTEGRAFLMERISKNLDPALAIQLLTDAMWGWDQYLHTAPPEAERYRSMQMVLPLLEVRETQHIVLYFIRAAVFHPDFPWQDKDGVSPLAALKKAYNSTTDEYFKSRLEGLSGEIERK